jgi:hypothetical protein
MKSYYDNLETSKSLIDVSSYDSYNEFAAAKVSEMSDMIIVLCTQYEETNDALRMAQYSWLREYHKHHKGRRS